MQKINRTLAAAAALALIAAPAYAQSLNTGATGTYGQIQLRAGFEPDPFTVSVLGGGAIDMSAVNESCNGFVAQRASYTLRYTSNHAEYPTLYIGAMSDADTTIAVRTPNNQWICNDDAVGLNPMVAIESPRNGRYQIWVGRYGTENESAQANLFISEVGGPEEVPTVGEGGNPDWNLDPAYGAIDLAAGFMPDPHTVEIAAGGGLDASVVGCVGWVAQAPDYRVNWTAGGTGLPLIFSVQSEADTVLLINDAEGNWLCNDDTNGLNPAISIANPPSGQYDVWVGTYAQGDLQDSVLSVSEVYSGE
jgi:hypothetical protein